jgi:F-type H+-transporting ATPase subunit b
VDNATIIAVASIVIAGITTGFGTMGPALAEGRAVATALSSLAQQPDASATITRTLFVGLAMIESTAMPTPSGATSSLKPRGSERMLADWFTIVAQALNFLILVWLMKRFLYKPVLNAIDEREKRVAAELADAGKKKAEAQKEHDEFQRKNTEFDEQRAALLKKATDEARTERQRLLDEARAAADTLSAKRRETLRSQEQELRQAIGRRTQQEVFAVTRKALADLATTCLEERIGEVFTRRLREMDSKAKESLGEALKTASGPAVVRSAFDLPAGQRAAIQNALNETFSAEIRIQFETAPDLVGGIELTANGQKVAWSIADYLATMQTGVDELVNGKATTGQ